MAWMVLKDPLVELVVVVCACLAQLHSMKQRTPSYQSEAVDRLDHVFCWRVSKNKSRIHRWHSQADSTQQGVAAAAVHLVVWRII